jgi:hypothetical protein
MSEFVAAYSEAGIVRQGEERIDIDVADRYLLRDIPLDGPDLVEIEVALGSRTGVNDNKGIDVPVFVVVIRVEVDVAFSEL